MAEKRKPGRIVNVEVKGNKVFVETDRGMISITPSERDGILVAYNTHEGSGPTKTIRG